MVSRTLLTLFAVALIAITVSAHSAEEVDVDDVAVEEEFERGFKSWVTKLAKEGAKKIIKEVVDFFKTQSKKVNLECAKEIYDTCDINPLAHPKKYYKCAKNYIVENKAHCYHDE